MIANGPPNFATIYGGKRDKKHNSGQLPNAENCELCRSIWRDCGAFNAGHASSTPAKNRLRQRSLGALNGPGAIGVNAPKFANMRNVKRNHFKRKVFVRQDAEISGPESTSSKGVLGGTELKRETKRVELSRKREQKSLFLC